jgi:hypothetical protein
MGVAVNVLDCLEVRYRNGQKDGIDPYPSVYYGFIRHPAAIGRDYNGRLGREFNDGRSLPPFLKD